MFFAWYLCYLPIDLLRRHRPESDVSHLISVPPDFSWTFLMAYSKGKLYSGKTALKTYTTE
jgi:hypothetical protein